MKRLALMAGVTALILALAVGTGALAAKKPSTNPAPTLRSLVRQTKSLPHFLGNRRQHHALMTAAKKARRSLKKHACVSVRQLSRYRRILARIHTRKGKRYTRANAKLESLGPTSLEASRRLMFSKKTRRCGGGKKPNTRTKPVTKVLASDENGMSLQVQLPAVQFGTKTGGGQTWNTVSLPNTYSPSAPGKPAIPVIGENFAIPDGAKVTVDPGKTSSYTLGGVKLYPSQPDVADADTQPPNFFAGPFADKPFTLNRRTYKSDSLFPAKPASGEVLGNFRDITLGALQLPGAQYRPASQTLKVLNTVNVRVQFTGGLHSFDPNVGSPWEFPEQKIISSLINRNIFTKYGPGLLRRCGEEMLVITNPATQAAADSFATARRNAGMRVSVVQVGSGAGQIGATPADIQAYIRGELTRFLCIHPSYITILGDDDLVPTFTDYGGIPSDLEYAMKDNSDELPDVAIGRILGNDQNAVQTVVNKTIGYETAPPGGAWLRHATIAAQFQDDNTDGQEERTFVWFAETVRRGLTSALGVAADRVYAMGPATTPQKFNDGTPLPAGLLQPTFAWNGNGTDVSNDWNDGRFLMIHRDHGWSDGWGMPGYGTTDVQALHNGNLLPVLLSINCSSAAYDYDETSFVSESLVNPNGGAVGAFGDTRDSPSWHNSQLGLGLVDALLPRILPSEGPATKQRMGYALINGKLRLNGLAPYTGDGNTHNELYLWHYFGDPSMQMWGGDPIHVVDPGRIDAVFTRQAQIPVHEGDPPPPYAVNVTLPTELAGQPISLLRDGQVIGKAFVGGDGKATIGAGFGDGAPKPGELEVSMEADGYEPVKVPVKDVPPTATRIDTTCPAPRQNQVMDMTTSGTISPAVAGLNIIVHYDPPNGEPSFERTVTTDSNGAWSDSIKPGEHANSYGGDWKVTARFDGNGQYAASQGSTCTVSVFGN